MFFVVFFHLLSKFKTKRGGGCVCCIQRSKNNMYLSVFSPSNMEVLRVAVRLGSKRLFLLGHVSGS